jgi:sigma-E factor negative regulatory protein RseC
MKQVETGVVIEINGNMAKVKAARHGDCENCGSCPGDSAMVLDVLNPLEAKPGQKVAFEIPQANMLLAAFMVYIMPLVAAALGAVAGWFIATRFGLPMVPMEIAGGVVVFVLALIVVKLYDGSVRRNKKMLPVITKILS